jgi:hypothetical protein
MNTTEISVCELYPLPCICLLLHLWQRKGKSATLHLMNCVDFIP